MKASVMTLLGAAVLAGSALPQHASAFVVRTPSLALRSSSAAERSSSATTPTMAASSAVLSLAAAFGVPTSKNGVKDLVANFDFSKVTASSKSDEYLNIALAPAFGTLDSDSIKLMDDNLKVMIAATVAALGKLEDKSWDKVVSTLTANPLLEPMDDVTTRRDDKFIREGTNWFKFDGSPQAPVVREVETWFHKLVADDDVLNSTGIDINVLAKIVAATGARVEDFKTLFFKKETNKRDILEIGVLRFPDLEHPYFKVYRIKLTAWADCTRIVFAQEDTNGITGTFASRRFKPREKYIAAIKKEVLDRTMQEVENFLPF